ncbi:hypothetical protein DOT_1122 [Desulfosporosinus sp. OT]|nr:hypothetical protein DOT_1122 [Desulfosporosinus sp. OT]
MKAISDYLIYMHSDYTLLHKLNFYLFDKYYNYFYKDVIICRSFVE